ncbi:MAG: DUF2147 domain-containing protein [Beijerinckiaceae bacterium]|nr:DUF2147 domain-containing protein [Beijerinckiaceae bacterium]
MKTSALAIALALLGGAAHAGTLFEVPINGGIARIQLDDDCERSICASVSWSENEPRHIRKEPIRKKSAKPSAAAKTDTAPSASLPSTGSAAASGSDSGMEASASLKGQAPPAKTETAPSASLPPSGPSVPAASTKSQGPAGPAKSQESTPAKQASEEPQDMASLEPEPGIGASEEAAESGPAPKPEAEKAVPKPAAPAPKAAAKSPVGEWLVEGGEGRIRIDECGRNLCGVVSAAKNANDTDRKNPNSRLRSRPILGLPVLLDMKPVEKNLWEGRIYNAKNGQTYVASISLDNPQTLRVEGCAFGGLICGSRTWNRFD